MKRYTPLRLPFEVASLILGIAVLTLPPRVAFAQHGGGGHMGGGGHFGGGFGGHSSASTSPSHSPAAAHSGSTARSSAPLAEQRPARPVVEVGESGAGRSHAVPLRPPSESQAAVTTEASSSPRLFIPPPEHTTIGFPPATTPTTLEAAQVRFAPSAGPLSFSGQGHRIWQNTPSAPTARFDAHILAGQPLTTRPHPPHRTHPPGFFERPSPPVGVPVFGFSPFCGFGWGCDLFDWSMFGCNYLGYGYGYGLGYGSGPAGYYSPGWDSGVPSGADDSSEEPSPSTWQSPPADQGTDSVTTSIPHTLIYLQDGTSYEVTDYWLSDNKLHYVTNYGGENAVDLSRIDMQRTVDANAGRGVSFTLHPAPPPQLTPPPSSDNEPGP